MRRTILVTITALSLPWAAQGATYSVCPDGSGNFLTIQPAIDQAVAGDRIELCDAIFTGPGNRDLDYQGKAITVCSQSGNAAACIIDCGGSPGDPHRGFYFHSGEGSGAVLRDLTIQNAFSFAPGGGIHCDGASPAFTNCTFLTNLCLDNGAGLYCTNCAPTLTDCRFIDNGDGTGNSGAGMACMGSSPTLTNCTFSGNFINAGGGGLFCGYNSSPHLIACTFEENIVQAMNGYGAGLFCYYLSSPILEDCDFLGNMGHLGGAAAFFDQCDPELTGCIFTDNTADNGGGLYFQQTCIPEIEACTFADNSAVFYGGAIWCSGVTPNIMSCTLAGNGAGTDGGGIHLYQSSPTIDQTIIAFGTSGAAIYCYDAGCTPTLTCSDVYGNAGGDWIGCIAAQAGLAGNISLDPEFCNAAMHDFGLEPTSPCAPGGQCGLMGAWPVGCSGSDVAQEDTRPGGLALRISPNPCRAGANVRFELPGRSAAARVGVYDTAGRLVRAWHQTDVHTWNVGQNIAAGMYFVRLTADQRTVTERLMLVR